MKNKIFALVIAPFALLVALAAPINLEGKVKFSSDASKLRVGIFSYDRNGKVGAELSSSKLQNQIFNLAIPEAAPQITSYAITGEQLDWPGLVGKVVMTGSAQVVRVGIQAYQDNDGSNTYTAPDKLLESFATRERGGLVLMWSETKFSVQAERGFHAELTPGWNLLSIELGKQVTVTNAQNLKNISLEVFNK